MENKKLFMDGMGIKSMLWMGAMGIAFVNADAVDNLTGKAVWQQENISCEVAGENYCSGYGYTYYKGDCAQKSSGFVNEGEGYKSYRMCAYLQAVKLANYALKGETGEDEVKMLKEKCVAKSTEEKGYDYQDFNCDTKWYGYMSQDTLDICTSQLGLIKAAGGTDGEGWGKYSYDVCSFQPGTYAKTYYGIGAVAQSEKMVKQARDAEQQVTDDKAKNAEDKEDVNEAKKGRLHVYECSDAVEKKEAKDIYFCFVKDAGDRFFGDIESDWEGKHMVTIEKLDGTKSTLEEIEIEVWDKCGDVTDSCGRTTSKDVEYFTKNEKYVLLKKGAEKKR
jgi:hypothetical protein